MPWSGSSVGDVRGDSGASCSPRPKTNTASANTTADHRGDHQVLQDCGHLTIVPRRTDSPTSTDVTWSADRGGSRTMPRRDQTSPRRAASGARVPRIAAAISTTRRVGRDLVGAEDRRALPGRDGGRGQGALQPLIDRQVQGLADEVLVGQRHQHRPTGGDQLRRCGAPVPVRARCSCRSRASGRSAPPPAAPRRPPSAAAAVVVCSITAATTSG